MTSPTKPSTFEELRIVDVDDFGDRKLEFGGPWNEMLVRVFDAASSDVNGRAVVIPEGEFYALILRAIQRSDARPPDVH